MNERIPWDLIVSKLRQDLSDGEEQSFQKWLEQDNNQQLFQQLEIVWENIQRKVETYEPDVEYYWKELSSRIDRSVSEEDIKSENQQKTKHKFFRHLYKKIAVAVLVIAISGGCFYYFLPQKTTGDTPQTYFSTTEKSKVILPDGTEVWLNSNTVLTYTKSETPGLREVSLEGEAYFDVRHDAQSPFIIKTDDVSIKVHGTQFNVNSYKASKETVISLYEGSISMKIADMDLFLKPGEEAYFNKKSKTINIEKGRIEFSKTWTQDRVRIENKNMREVCRLLSKKYGVEIIVDSSISDNQSYTFTLKDQSLEEVFQIMSTITPINYAFTENQIIITSKE